MRDSQRTRPTRRPRRLEEVQTADVGFPITWVIIGALAGLIVLGLVGLGVVNIIRKQYITPTPENIPGLAPTQEIADSADVPDGATPTIPPVVTLAPTVTPIPTETPIPVAPTELTPSGYAEVTGTEGLGVSLRSGPGTNNARLTTAPEGSVVLILDGPRDDENLGEFIWWLVRGPDDIEGWAAQDFLIPALPPESADN
ncbi:MAG: SH3 domain-containing protein [Chloroflexota bacterium]